MSKNNNITLTACYSDCVRSNLNSMKKIHNKKGLKYGKLTVLSKKIKIDRNWHWECECECGIIRFINTCKLNNSKHGQKSCGCAQFGTKENLIDQKFGKLTVISFSHIDKKLRYQFWNCVCDCGNKTIKSTTVLRRNNHPTHSCGCLRNEAIILSGHDYNRKQSGESSINTLIYIYKKAAKKRNLPFNINREDFIRLTSQNCFYCNVPPKQIMKKRICNGPYIYNGLDRKNNDIGYEINNILPCCKVCNYAKRTMNYDEFLQWIQTVYDHVVKSS